LLALLYLRYNVSHEVVGSLFGVSADTTENVFPRVVPVLRDVCPTEKWDTPRRSGVKGEPSWTPDEVAVAIIDSFETPVRRPSTEKQQQQVYSGKKKRHTLKGHSL